MTKEKLGALIMSCEQQLYITAKTILWNDADIEDAVQEAVVKAFTNIHTLKKDRYAKTWLVRILINSCYDRLREGSRILPLEETIIADPVPDYSDLYHALALLSDDLKTPVILHYLDGFSIREAAEIMEISEGAVKKRLSRARGKLKEALTTEERP